MSIKLDIRIKLLEKPRNIVNCSEKRLIPSRSKPLYIVCLTDDYYIIYDAIVDDKQALNELRKIEAKLYDVVIGEKSFIDLLDKISDIRLKHNIERQFIGYGVLEGFFLDPDLVNVHIMADKPIQVIHRARGRMNTNITLTLEDTKELALRIAARAGKPVSEALPLASFIEPRYEARVTVIYTSDVTMRKNIVVDIRKQPENPWTILKLIKYGTLSFEEAAFLWLMVKYKVPVIIVGEIMTGKTTLATALASLIPPDARVLTAEDAPEFRIPVLYWTRTMTREFGEYKISFFDLIKTGVRLSVDYIIIGEIRGEEAREWAHSILLGHGAVTTFHAESPESALLRLLSPPISVDPHVIALLNVFVKTNVIERIPGERVFRHEVYVIEEGRTTPLFTYDPNSDKIVMNPDIKNPIYELKFVDRIVLANRVPKELLYKEYLAMIKALEETYSEAVSKDPTLETPTYVEIPILLYNKLRKYMAMTRSTLPRE
ncbi:MAG: type II/IV secretion system ATPase subunit [Desulfurococcaceae archaeon]